MLIDFENLQETIIMNLHGGEKNSSVRIFADDKIRVIYSRLEPGASFGHHVHETGAEIDYVISGVGEAEYDGQIEQLLPSVCHYCPHGHRHSLRNTGVEDLVFFTVVSLL